MAKATEKEIKEGKLCAILNYLVFIVGIIWWLADEKMKKNKFATFHVKQVLILIIVSIIVSFINIIPILGQIIFLIAEIIILVLWIIGLINAISGKEKELPIIGKFAEKLNF